jgi:hypothetical protein
LRIGGDPLDLHQAGQLTAVGQPIRWMVGSYGFTDASALRFGQVAEARCAQMMNPRYL